MSEREIEERRTTVVKLRDLSDRAQEGDEEAALNIRTVLDGSPDLAWRFIKEPAKMAESAMIDKVTTDEDLASNEFLSHQLESMRVELAGENPSPLERLLAERMVATWRRQVQLFEASMRSGWRAEPRSKTTTARSASIGRTGDTSRRSARSPRSASWVQRCRSTSREADQHGRHNNLGTGRPRKEDEREHGNGP